MADDSLLCGVDAGTTRIRAIVFEAAGGRVVAEGSAPTPTRHPGPGLGEHDAEELWRATVTALRAAVAGVERPARIRSVAVGSMGEAGVLLDRAGRPLAPVLAWYDGRPGSELARLERLVGGREALHRVTGLCPDPTFTLLKLLWLRAELPEAFAAATSWLGVSGWLAWRLCGERATDASLASRTLLLDLAAGRWSGELLAANDLPASLLGEIAPAGTLLSRVLPEIAAATGLPGDCVVGVGAHDHVCGLLALGADEPGVLLDSIGTAEALTLVVPAPSRSAELLGAGVNQGRVETGGPALFYLFGGLPTCSAAVEWFRSLWPDGADHATLIAEAEAVPAAEREILFLPQLRLGSPPFPDPVARGAFFGLSDRTSRGAMFRAVLEGLALDMANQLGLMRDHAGEGGVTRVVAAGGGTRNRLLTRLKASVYGAPAEAAEMPETTCLGAALLGGLAAGVFPDLDAGRGGLVATRRRLEPEPGWTEAERALRLATYRRAYAAARDIHALIRGAPEPG